MSKETSSGSGIGVIGLLGVAFVVLKLTGFIDWSWWLVTAPFWSGAALLLIGFSIYFIVIQVRSFRSKKRFNKKMKELNK